MERKTISYTFKVFFEDTTRDMIKKVKQILKITMRYVLIRIGILLWYVQRKVLKDVDILFLFKFADIGGSERVQHEILKVFSQNKTLVLITNKGKNNGFLKKYQQYSKVVDISQYADSIFGRWIVAGILYMTVKKSDIKIVFSSLTGLMYDMALLKKDMNTTYMDLFHGCDGNIEYYSLGSVENIDKRILIDSHSKEKLIELYRNSGKSEYIKRIIQVDNGVRIPSENIFSYKKNKSLKVLYVGRDSPEKRINLIRKIAQQYPQATFTLVGVDPHSNDPSNLNAVGLVDNVEEYYKSSNILLITSYREGFPMVVMEAMSYGVVPLVTDVGGISHHIHTGKNGYLIKSKNEAKIVEDFIEKMATLDSNRQQIQNISYNAYVYAKQHFSLEKFNREYYDLLNSYLKRVEK